MEEEKTIPIRTVLMPAYYKDFHCLADGCRDSCCKGWRIEFDKNDYLRLRRLDAPQEFKTRLDGAVKRLRGDDLQSNSKMFGKFQVGRGDCPLLEECGLCSLQLNCGGDALPRVCQVFPRLSSYTAAAMERCLTLGCEAVLQLLWELPDGVEFVEEELPKQEWRILHIRSEENLSAWFPDVRSLCIDILQAGQLPLSSRMLFLGLSLRELKDHGWSNQGAAEWVVRTGEQLASPTLAETFQLPDGNTKLCLLNNIKVAYRIQREDPTAPPLLAALDLRTSGEKTQHVDINLWKKAWSQFWETFGHMGYFFENIMVALALQTGFPDMSSAEALWKSYVNLCNLYSFYRFAAVTGCAEDPSKEQLIHVLTMVSRALLHSSTRQQALRDEFFKNDSASIAHMAILICG